MKVLIANNIIMAVSDLLDEIFSTIITGKQIDFNPRSSLFKILLYFYYYIIPIIESPIYIEIHIISLIYVKMKSILN